MLGFFRDYFLFIFTVTAGVLSVIFFCNLGFTDLEEIRIYAEIVTAGSLFIALLTYFYQRKKDKNLAAIDQISFFRKEIIPQCDLFLSFVRDKKSNQSYEFKKVRLDEPILEFAVKKYNSAVREQNDIYKEFKTWSMQTTLLNMLEELSLKIKLFKTNNHEALNSIRAPFVEMIEINAVVLLMQREIITGNQTYSAVINLYLEWKDVVDRRHPKERDKKFMEKMASFAR